MEKKELIEKLIKITNEGFTTVNLLPETFKKYSKEAYSCILDTLKEKAQKSYIDSQKIADFENDNLSVKIEFISSPKKAGIKEMSLLQDGEQILVLQGIMNVNLETLINKTDKNLSRKILKRLQKQKQWRDKQ